MNELAELRSGANATLLLDGSLHGDAICVFSKQIYRLSDRVCYLDRLPYLVARLGEDGMTDRFLSEYDAQLSNGTLHHRVSDAFAHPTQPSLRAHMIAARDAGGAMSATLRDRFWHYFYGMINELPCEGEHSDIQVEQQRSHGVRHHMASQRCALIKIAWFSRRPGRQRLAALYLRSVGRVGSVCVFLRRLAGLFLGC